MKWVLSSLLGRVVGAAPVVLGLFAEIFEGIKDRGMGRMGLDLVPSGVRVSARRIYWLAILVVFAVQMIVLIGLSIAVANHSSFATASSQTFKAGLNVDDKSDGSKGHARSASKRRNAMAYGGGSCRQGNKTKGPVTASDWPLSPLASLSVSAGLIRHSDAVPIDHFPTLPACEKQE
jgi:hypothetical protein